MAALKSRLPGSTLIEVLVSMSIISMVIIFTFLMLTVVAGSHLIALRILVSNEIAEYLNDDVVHGEGPAPITRYEGYYIEHSTECYSEDCNLKVLVIRAYSDNGRLLQEAKRLIEVDKVLPADNAYYEEE